MRDLMWCPRKKPHGFYFSLGIHMLGYIQLSEWDYRGELFLQCGLNFFGTVHHIQLRSAGEFKGAPKFWHWSKKLGVAR